MNPDLMKYLGIGGGLGSIGGGLYDYFGGGKNPSDAGMEYLNKIPDILKQYYNPWIDKGMGASDKTQSIYDLMSQDPNAFYNKIAGGYKESPGYQFRLKNALQAGTNAQAAGGMAGSPQHEQQNMELANDIAGKDFNDYLEKVLGINKSGLEGEENTIGRGFDASKNLADNLSNLLGLEASYKYKGQDYENKQKQGGIENILKGAGATLPWLFF